MYKYVLLYFAWLDFNWYEKVFTAEIMALRKAYNEEKVMEYNFFTIWKHTKSVDNRTKQSFHKFMLEINMFSHETVP
jgi:hypothetical protein